MVYLDYSATTPVNKEVLDTFNKTCLEFPGNPNSLHKLGVKSNELINAATRQIADILNVKEEEIIYTSGASESNNLAIKGIALKYQKRGNHIITTSQEHPATYGPISYLQTLGFECDFVDLDENGKIDLNNLKSLLREDTILVTIASVSSEIGIVQNINEVSKIVKENSKAFIHVDMTQSIGKIEVDLDNIDLASFSAHKIFGIKGVGALIKKNKIGLEPIIHGGKSTTAFRSGTPALPLIVSFAKALRLATDNLQEKINQIQSYNNYLKENLIKYDKVHINSNHTCIPQILNISVLGVKPETMLHALEAHDIYISTQTACSSNDTISKAVLALTKNKEAAESSIRISLSYTTTQEELDYFLEKFNQVYNELVR